MSKNLEQLNQKYEEMVSHLEKTLSNNGKGVYLTVESAYYDNQIHKRYTLKKVVLDKNLMAAKEIEQEYKRKIESLHEFITDYSNYLNNKKTNHVFKLENHNVSEHFLYEIIQVLIKPKFSPEIFKKIYEPLKNILSISQVLTCIIKNVQLENDSTEQFDYVYDLLENKNWLSKVNNLGNMAKIKSIEEIQRENDENMKYKIQNAFSTLEFFINHSRNPAQNRGGDWKVNYAKLSEKMELYLKNHTNEFPKEISERKDFENFCVEKLKKFLPEKYWFDLSPYFIIYSNRLSQNPLSSFEEKVILKFNIETKAILKKYPRVINVEEAEEMATEVFQGLKKYYNGDFSYDELGQNFNIKTENISVLIKVNDFENLNKDKIKENLTKASYIFESIMDSFYLLEMEEKSDKTPYLENMINELSLEMLLPNKEINKKSKKI